MPKLNNLQIADRISQRLEQLRDGAAIEARDYESLLSAEQKEQYAFELAKQKALRGQYKQPKTEQQRKDIGWKDKREVRIEIYESALRELEGNALDEIRKLQHAREVKAARVYMDAFAKALDEGKNADSAGNIALSRAGFRQYGERALTKRDIQIKELESAIQKEIESNMTADEREQFEILREHEASLVKKKKTKKDT